MFFLLRLRSLSIRWPPFRPPVRPHPRPSVPPSRCLPLSMQTALVRQKLRHIAEEGRRGRLHNMSIRRVCPSVRRLPAYFDAGDLLIRVMGRRHGGHCEVKLPRRIASSRASPFAFPSLFCKYREPKSWCGSVFAVRNVWNVIVSQCPPSSAYVNLPIARSPPLHNLRPDAAINSEKFLHRRRGGG